MLIKLLEDRGLKYLASYYRKKLFFAEKQNKMKDITVEINKENINEEKINEENFEIISDTICNSAYANCERKITNISRIIEVFAWRPYWIENKFRWFKKIKIKQTLHFIRYSEFDDGWTYTDYWKPWIKKWEDNKIL